MPVVSDEFLSENGLVTVLVAFCFYDYGANPSESV